MRTAIEEKLSSPTSTIFQEAQQWIFELMKNDSFRKFKGWQVDPFLWKNDGIKPYINFLEDQEVEAVRKLLISNSEKEEKLKPTKQVGSGDVQLCSWDLILRNWTLGSHIKALISRIRAPYPWRSLLRYYLYSENMKIIFSNWKVQEVQFREFVD